MDKKCFLNTRNVFLKLYLYLFEDITSYTAPPYTSAFAAYTRIFFAGQSLRFAAGGLEELGRAARANRNPML